MYKRGIFARLRKSTRFRVRGRVYGSTNPPEHTVHAGRRPRPRRRPPTAEDLGWTGLVTLGIGALLHLSITTATYERVPPEVFVLWLLAACVALAYNALAARTSWLIRIQGALLNLLYVPLAVWDLVYLWG